MTLLMRTRRLALPAVLTLAAAAVAVPTLSQRWTASDRAQASVLAASCTGVDLGTLGGRYGSAVATSASGDVVGVADDGSGVSHPVVWHNGPPAQLNVGLSNAVPSGINNSGAVVGVGVDATGIPTGWQSAAGRVVRLTVASGMSAFPAAISNSGVIVGAVVDSEHGSDGPGADAPEQAVEWPSAAAAAKVLRPLPGDIGAHAFAVNSAGVVGGVSEGSQFTPVFWDASGAVHALPGMGGGWGAVLDVADNGEAVGGGAAPGGTNQPLRWDTASRVRHTLPPLASARGGLARGVSAAATVGQVDSPVAGGGVRSQAVRWSPQGVPQLLAPLSGQAVSGVSATANAADTTGAAVGYSADSKGGHRPTEWRC
jgi:hypothetical protein